MYWRSNAEDEDAEGTYVMCHDKSCFARTVTTMKTVNYSNQIASNAFIWSDKSKTFI